MLFKEFRGRQTQDGVAKKFQFLVIDAEPCGGVGEGLIQPLQVHLRGRCQAQALKELQQLGVALSVHWGESRT